MRPAACRICVNAETEPVVSLDRPGFPGGRVLWEDFLGWTRSVRTVDQKNVSATLTVAVPAARVFAVLADPTYVTGRLYDPGFRSAQVLSPETRNPQVKAVD